MKRLIAFLILFCCVSIYAESPGDDIRSVIEPYIDNGELPGVVTIVADRDNVLDLQCFGYCDIESGKKMNPDALFWIASQTKAVTGVAIMMLVEEGKLDLDEPVTTYLPELNSLMVKRVGRDSWRVLEKVGKPITLRNLLCHTAGVDGNAGMQQLTGYVDVLPLNLSLYSAAMTPLLCDPDERFIYSNQGIDIAAMVLERISGIPYEDFLRQRLFGPLSMESATFWPTDRQMENYAVSYKKDEDGRLVPTTVNLLQPLSDKGIRYASPSAGLFCTPNDLVKFYQMMASGGTYNGKKYLSEASVKEIGTDQTGEKIAAKYGLGWFAADASMGHAGAYGTNSLIHKETGLIVMYFVQSAGLPKEAEVLAAYNAKVAEIYGLKW